MKTITCPIIVAALACSASVALAQAECEPQRLVSPPEVQPFDFGGRAVTNGRQWLISDARASIPCFGGSFCLTGAVYSYEMVDGRLVHRQTLTPPNPGGAAFYGTGLDIDGNRLIVGTLNYTWPDNPRKGGAFVYEYNGEQWVEVGQIQKPDIDPVFLNNMGVMTKMHDGLALLPAGSIRKVVLTFQETVEGWAFHELIESPDGLPREASFGAPIAMGGQWVFISAAFDATLMPFGGSVYVYQREADNTLTFVQKIDSPDALAGQSGAFGTGLAFDGETLAVGSPNVQRDEASQGVVYTYEFDGQAWVQRQELAVAEPAELESFGQQLSFRDGVMLVFSSRSISGIADNRVYTFRLGTDGLWREAGLLVPNPPVVARQYGIASATDGRHALVGAANDVHPDAGVGTASWLGAAYLFDLACDDCPADLDGDGVLTIFDFLTFQNLFAAGDLQADFDGDGELTIFDFLAFQTAFAVGCG